MELCEAAKELADRQPWKLNCENFRADCRQLDGKWYLFSEIGCGETLVALVNGPKGEIVDSNPVLLSALLSSPPQGLTSTCSNLRISSVRPISSSQRATIYEALSQDGNRFLVKVMRRADRDNVEHMVLRYLTDAGFTHAPRYVCHAELDLGPFILVSEYVEGEPAASIYVAESSGHETVRVEQLGSLVGKAVAELHQTLYACNEDWCRPEPITEDDVNRWISRLSWRSRWLRTQGTELVPRYERPLVLEAADALEELAGYALESAMLQVGRYKMRTHGDLHLYQIILVGNNIMITDFEGEPYRFPALKVEKEHLMRDLAALARSIDYAAAMGIQIRYGTSLGDASVISSRELATWEVKAFKSIFDSYATRLREMDSPLASELLPRALGFWIIERASYEAVYELTAHTGYHDIPLNAIIRMIDGNDPLLNYVSRLR